MRNGNTQGSSMSTINNVTASLIMTALLVGCTSSGSKKNTDFGETNNVPTEIAAIPEPQTLSQTAPTQQATLVQTNNVVQQRIAIREDTPESYIVKRGDTLWGIATLFLQDPWLWPQIWYFNPQIDNPHLIYPGDIITLVYVDGKPQLRLQRDGDTVITQIPSSAPGLQTFKLSPRVRSESINSAIATVPLNAIRPFLVNPRVVSEEELEAAPYVLSSLDNHLANAAGNRIYVRGLKTANESRYNIFRPGKKFYDPDTNELLGMQTLKVSEAQLNQLGDPSTLTITNSLRETLNGDRILPAEQGRLDYNFIPKAPENNIEGKIISLVDSISYSSTNQIVVLNLGDNDGIDVGNVFAIDQTVPNVRDHWTSKRISPEVKIPELRIGLLMVFRVFDRVSYAIVVDAKRPITTKDMVRNPNSIIDDYR